MVAKGGYANPYLLSKQFATKGSEPSPLLKRGWLATYGSQFFGVGGMDYFEEEMDLQSISPLQNYSLLQIIHPTSSKLFATKGSERQVAKRTFSWLFTRRLFETILR